MIRYFCFHSSMKEVKVLCLFCPPPVDFTFIHVTFSVFSLNNVVRMLFLDLVTIRRTSWFHLKYLVLLPHAHLEIIRGQVWKSGHRRRSERDFIEMTKRCHEDCEMHHHHHLILVLVLRPHWTATDHNPSVFEFCKIQTVFLEPHGRQREVTVESWEVNMNHAAAERKSITRHKKKTPGFYHKEGFLWIHRTLSGAFISNQASFHAALKCTGTYKNHSRSRQRVREVNMSKGSEITNKWGFYRFMFCWREKNSLTFYNIN